MNEQNVLESVKSTIGPMMGGTDAFDMNILSFVDTALLPLMQLGCIKQIQYPIDSTTTWDEIINPPSNPFYANEATYAAIRQYVGIKAKVSFDPPASGNASKVYEEIQKENFWRIKEAYDD